MAKNNVKNIKVLLKPINNQTKMNSLRAICVVITCSGLTNQIRLYLFMLQSA